MALFFSVQLGSGAANARTFPISGVGLGGRTSHHARGEFTPAVAFTVADQIDMFDLPPRARILGAFLKYEGQTDSNGAPTLAVNVGSIATPALIFAGSTVGRTVGPSVDATMNPLGRDFQTVGKTRIRLVPTANAATFVPGQKIVLVVNYTVEEPL
jgi:hypothetical protein